MTKIVSVIMIVYDRTAAGDASSIFTARKYAVVPSNREVLAIL